jgi:branched-subunit amino acid transport protein
MTSTMDGAEQAARSARDSRPVEALARLGLASRGLVFLVLAALAFSLVRGDAAQADQNGALAALEDTPLGGSLLAVLALGFAGYAGWLLLSAAVGHRGEEHRTAHRLKSAGKGAVYLALCASTVSFLLRGGQRDETASRTAEVMSMTGGRSLVGLVGLVVLGIGGYLAVKGVTRKHAECLEQYRVPRPLRLPAIVCGAIGYVGRGVTVGLIGAFLLSAAVRFDPDEAKGLDAALQTVAQQPYGRILLGLTAVGLLAYGLWSFVEAAFRRI